MKNNNINQESKNIEPNESEIDLIDDDKKQISRRAKIISLTICFVIGTALLLMSLPTFFNLSNLKTDIEAALSKELNVYAEIEGKANLEILPFPAINIKNVLIKNYHKDNKTYNFFAKNIKIRLSIFSLFNKEILIKKIIISKSIIEGGDINEAEFKSEESDIFNKLILVSDKNIVENLVEKNLDEKSENKAQEKKLAKIQNQEIAQEILPENKINSEEIIEKLENIDKTQIDDSSQESNLASKEKLILAEEIIEDKSDEKNLAEKNINPNQEKKPENNIASNQLFSVKNLAKNQFSKELMPKIVFDDSRIIIHQKNFKKIKLEKLTAEVVIKKDKIISEGSFIKDKQQSEFEIIAFFDAKINDDNSQIKITSSAFELLIKGSFTSKNKGIINSDFVGKMELEISDLKLLHANFLDGDEILNKKLKDNINNIIISSEVSNNNGEVNLEKIKIASDFASASGKAMIDLTNIGKKIDLFIDFTSLDLDQIINDEKIPTLVSPSDLFIAKDQGIDNLRHLKEFSEEKIIEEKPTEKIQKEEIEKINPKLTQFELSAEITAKEIKILNNKINDLALFLKTNINDEIEIHNASFEVANIGKSTLEGVLSTSKNSKLPRFYGNFSLIGDDLGSALKNLNFSSSNLKFDYLKNFQIFSKFIILPNNISLDLFYLNLNQGKNEFFGKINYDNNQKSKIFNNNFEITNFNYDDFFLIGRSNYYFEDGQLVRKLLWLNEIPYQNNITAKIKNFTFNNQQFRDNSEIDLSIGQGFFKINKINLASENINLTAALNIDISQEKPFLDVKIKADEIDLSTLFDQQELSQNSRQSIDFIDQIKDEIDSNKKNNSPSSQENNKKSILSYLLMMPDLEGFNGEINLDFAKLNLAKNQSLDKISDISDFKFLGKMIDGKMENANLNCKIFSGEFDYQGLVSIKHLKTLNGSFVLRKIQMSEFLADLVNFDKISAITNLVGNINFEATNREVKLAEKVKSEIKFNASSVKIKSFGLTDLVNKMFYANFYRTQLLEFEKIILNDALQTNFLKAEGEINFNKNPQAKIVAKLSAPAINQVFSGNFNLSEKSVNAVANIIFVTGNSSKKIPINIAIATSGKFNQLNLVNNFDQIRSYLRLDNRQSEAGIIKKNITDNQLDGQKKLPQLMNSNSEEKSVIINQNQPANQINSQIIQQPQ